MAGIHFLNFSSTIIDDIVRYFVLKYPYTGSSDPYSDASYYLKNDIPIAELAEYLERYFRENNSIIDFEDFLWTLVDAYGEDFDTMVSDYMPDCSLINCVLPELGEDTRGTVDDMFFSPEDPFIFSQLFYCNSSLFSNKVTQNITTRFSNNLIASSYPDFFVNAIDNYPYTGLLGDLAAGDNILEFYYCYPKEVTRALLEMLTREFMNELGGQITLNDIVIDFLLTPPVGADLETYLLENIDRDQFIDYLFINYGSELETVVSNLDGAYDEVLGNRILLNALTECQFKSCLKDNWDDIIGSDTSVIYEFVRYNDWVNVASGVFTSYPDSFTQAFAYLYSTNVASILENWHYSLYAFMDGIESFYGSGMKDKVDGDTLVLTQYVRMKEFHLYGASRLGILNQNDTLKRADLHYKLSISDPSQEPELFVETEDMDQYAPDSIYTLKQGNRLYEGSNHLGNVLVTFSDKRIGYCTNDTIYYYRADIRTANDYSAFGAPLDDRQWYSTADSGVYRFGFNGQEKDDEVSGVGNSNTAAYWQYDNRLGKRFNMDMIVKADESSYATFSNNPIYFVDYNGLTPTNPGGDDLNIGEPVDGPSMMDDGNSGGGHIIAKTAPLPKAGTSEDNRSNYGRVPSTYEGRLILGNLFNNLGNAKNYSPTNEELGAKAFREVRLLYNGSAVADHFMSNTGTPLVTSVPQSDNPNGPAWDNLISEIGTGLLSQYDGHNLSSINDIPISNPHFIGVGNVCMDISYAGILGGIQNTYVVCHNIKIIEKTVYEVGTGRPITVRGIQAEVQIVVSDWFGVSEDDYTKKMNSVAASQRGALAAFWALQHQRGYKPFVNVYTFRTTITKYEE